MAPLRTGLDQKFVEGFTGPNREFKLELTKQLFIASSATHNFGPATQGILEFFNKGTLVWKGNIPIRMYTKPTATPVNMLYSVPVGHHLAIKTTGGTRRSAWEFKNYHRLQVVMTINNDQKHAYTSPELFAEQVERDAHSMAEALPWFFTMFVKMLFQEVAETKKYGGKPTANGSENGCGDCCPANGSLKPFGEEYMDVWGSKCEIGGGYLALQQRLTVEQIVGCFDATTGEYKGLCCGAGEDGKCLCADGTKCKVYNVTENALEKAVENAAKCIKTMGEETCVKSKIKQVQTYGSPDDQIYIGWLEGIEKWLLLVTTQPTSEYNLGLKFKKAESQMKVTEKTNLLGDINLGCCAKEFCSAKDAMCSCCVPHDTVGSDYAILVNPVDWLAITKAEKSFLHTSEQNISNNLFGAKWIKSYEIKLGEILIMHKDAFYFATVGDIESGMGQIDNYNEKEIYWNRLMFTFGFQPFPCRRFKKPT